MFDSGVDMRIKTTVTFYTDLVSRNEFVAERETIHQSSLLQPEDRGEAAAKEDTLDRGERDHAFWKRRAIVIDPIQRPIGFLCDARHGLDRIKQVISANEDRTLICDMENIQTCKSMQ